MPWWDEKWVGMLLPSEINANSLHVQEKVHDFLLDALGGSRFDAKSDKLLG